MSSATRSAVEEGLVLGVDAEFFVVRHVHRVAGPVPAGDLVVVAGREEGDVQAAEHELLIVQVEAIYEVLLGGGAFKPFGDRLTILGLDEPR